MVNGGALGTPSSGTVTNLTGTASININGTVGATTATTVTATTIAGTDTTDASSTTTGALKTAGGLAVVKKIYVGDNVVPAAAKGMNFSGNTPAAGMTSQLLNWYEEGTWTPSLGGTTTYNIQQGNYTKIGRLVHVTGILAINAIGTGSTGTITGLPFTAGTSTGVQSGSVAYWENPVTNSISVTCGVGSATTSLYIEWLAAASNVPNNGTGFFTSGTRADFACTYWV